MADDEPRGRTRDRLDLDIGYRTHRPVCFRRIWIRQGLGGDRTLILAGKPDVVPETIRSVKTRLGTASASDRRGSAHADRSQQMDSGSRMVHRRLEPKALENSANRSPLHSHSTAIGNSENCREKHAKEISSA